MKRMLAMMARAARPVHAWFRLKAKRSQVEAIMETDTHAEVTPGFDDNPDKKWIVWTVWAFLSLALVIAAVVFIEVDRGLLLGWAVGIMVAALLMVFGKR